MGRSSNVEVLKPGESVVPRRSLAEVVAEIDQEFGALTLEELEHRPHGKNAVVPVERELEPQQAQLREMFTSFSMKVRELERSSVPLVSRRALVNRLVKKLAHQPHHVVCGPAGSGKSTIFARELMSDPRARVRFPHFIRLDCAGLRMSSASQFAKTATWSAFGTNEAAFRQYMNAYEAWAKQDSSLDPFIALLEARFSGGGVLILDHMEHMTRSEELNIWLGERLLGSATRHNYGVIFCDQSAAAVYQFKKLWQAALPVFQIGNLNGTELKTWLAEPFFKSKSLSLTAAEVLRVTGGSPRLIRDLSNFLVMHKDSLGKDTLHKFSSWRVRQYVAHCERAIWAMRSAPQCLFQGLSALSVEGVAREERSRIRQVLLETGVIRERKNGEFYYASPIHRQRMQILTGRDVLPLILLRARKSSFTEFQSHLDRLKHFAEISVDPVAQCLTMERNPRIALHRLQSILERWGFQARLYLRDRNNRRLLLELTRRGDEKLNAKGDQLFPMMSADFIRAIQTGRSTVTDEDATDPNELIIPVVGYTGVTELIVMGRFCSGGAPQAIEDIRRDRFVNLLRGLRPTLSQILDRFWALRDRRVRDHLLYGTKDAEPNEVWQLMLKALTQGEPAALAVLRRHDDKWRVSSFHRVGRSDGENRNVFRNSAWANPIESKRLDELAVHPSRHGLVLGNEEAKRIFPRLVKEEDASVYMRPVWFRDLHECRLVMFLFKKAPGGGLDGNVQKRLDVAAHAIAAATDATANLISLKRQLSGSGGRTLAILESLPARINDK